MTLRKHGVSFDQHRFATIGASTEQRLLFVAHTDSLGPAHLGEVLECCDLSQLWGLTLHFEETPWRIVTIQSCDKSQHSKTPIVLAS